MQQLAGVQYWTHTWSAILKKNVTLVSHLVRDERFHRGAVQAVPNQAFKLVEVQSVAAVGVKGLQQRPVRDFAFYEAQLGHGCLQLFFVDLQLCRLRQVKIMHHDR